MKIVTVFQSFYVITILFTLIMSYKSLIHKHPLAKYVFRMFLFAAIVCICYLVCLCTESKKIWDLMSSILFIFMDFMLYSILCYTIVFSHVQKHFKYLKLYQTILLTAIVIDFLILLTNPLHHLGVDYAPFQVLGITIYRYMGKLPFFFHLGICYFMLMSCTVILIMKCHITPKKYRTRYLNILLSFLFLAIVNCIFLLVERWIPIDISFPFYSIAVVVIYNNTFQYANSASMTNSKRLILEYLDTPVALFDYEGNLAECNQIFTKLFPNTADYITTPISLQQFEDETGLMITANTEQEFLEKTLKDEHGLHYYHCHLIPFSDEKGITIGHLLVCNNITKELEALHMAEDAMKSKSIFLSNMSHEIRTPINAVLGMDEMILRDCQDETILEYATNIRNAGKLLLNIINDILDISKIEANNMSILPSPYKVIDLLDSLHAVIDLRAKEKGLSLTFHISPDIPSVLEGDKFRLQQCITNLLTNAIKYTPEGSVTFDLSYQSIDDSTLLLLISVTDTGIGIREEDIGKLFKTFQRLDEKRNQNIEGTGLGLHLTEQLVSLMNGQVSVTSVYGKGSTFSISVPQKIIDTTPYSQAAIKRNQKVLDRRNELPVFTAPDATILVVDDNKVNLTVFKGLLKRTQIRIDMALSAKEGLELLKTRHYDCIFLDHMMPELDGIEMLTCIREMKEHPNQDVPCIALTANVYRGAEQFYKNQGFTDYLSKPIDSKLLETLLYQILPKELIHEQ